MYRCVSVQSNSTLYRNITHVMEFFLPYVLYMLACINKLATIDANHLCYIYYIFCTYIECKCTLI